MPSAAHEALVQRLTSSGTRTPESPPSAEMLAAMRVSQEETFSARPPTLTVTRRQLGSVDCLDISREGNDDSPTIVFFHGGGYIWESPWTHLELVDGLLKATNGRCISVNYRKAPEYTFPAPVDDAVEVYRSLLGEGVDPASIFLSGDSAGGGLVLAALIALRDSGDVLPAGGISFSPWTDLTISGASADAADDPVVSGAALRMMATMYLGGADPTSPLASPLYAELAGLPPVLVQVGTREGLLDDSRRFVTKAKDAGVDIELIEHVDVIHMWVVFGPQIPESIQAFDHAGDFVRRVTAR